MWREVLGEVEPMESRWNRELEEDHEQIKREVRTLASLLKKGAHSEEEARRLSCLAIHSLAPGLEMHLRKEERVLFPTLEKLLGGGGGFMEILQQEHSRLRELIRQLANFLCECGCSAEETEWEGIRLSGEEFVELLGSHERREEEMLAQILESNLKPYELSELARDFHRVAWSTFQEQL